MKIKKLRDALYLSFCVLAIILWANYGNFEAIMAPYVGF